MLGKKLTQMLPAACAARIAVIVHKPASREGLVYLGVQVLTIGQDQKSEVAAELTVNLAGEEYHGVTLACSLCVPEHPKLTL